MSNNSTHANARYTWLPKPKLLVPSYTVCDSYFDVEDLVVDHLCVGVVTFICMCGYTTQWDIFVLYSYPCMYVLSGHTIGDISVIFKTPIYDMI